MDERLERLRAEHVNIMNRLRDAESMRDMLRDNIAEMIGDLETQNQEIESTYKDMHDIEDEILRLSGT
ncbi:MAG: hypothetical protein IS632_00140 [Thaumarchaeota archaeon]|nr:hypothetical protein [Nitrososphaerota archaeon]